MSKKTIIYMRHGHDQKSHLARFDEKLSDFGKSKARHLAKKLLRKHGLPNIIFYSPFHRTQQTKNEFIKAIREYKKKHQNTDKDFVVEYAVDPRLGRFFTSKERATYSSKNLRKSTLKHPIIFDKGHTNFKARVSQQYQSLLEEKNDKDRVVWNISHSLVLKHVARINNIDFPSYVKFLDYFTIKK